MNKIIDKVGGILLSEKRILVVGKKGASEEEYILPGGKREPGESDLETLSRELKEEISIDITSYSFFGEYTDIALYEHIPIIIKAYLVSTDSEIIPQNEIRDYLWIDREYHKKKIKLGSVVAKHIIPKLISMELM